MKKRVPNGFTIIELLVATGVTVIIVGLMITMVNNLLSAYNRSSGTLSAQVQASLFLDQMALELESMVVRDSDDYMFTVEQVGLLDEAVRTTPVGIDIPDEVEDRDFPPIEDYRFGEGGLWLKFFTTAPSMTLDQESAGVRAVGYRIDFNPVVPNSPSRNYMLYRTQIPPQVTFDWGYDLIDPFYRNSDTYTYTPDPTDDDDDPDPVTRPNGFRSPDPPLAFLPSEILADNVVDFGVRLFVHDDGVRYISFPLTAGQQYAASSDPDTDDYPKVVEVMVRVLTPEGERILENLREDRITPPDGTTRADYWWEIVREHSEVFSRVVQIPSKPI